MPKGLGRGLNALFPGELDTNEDAVHHIALKELRVNPYQPRKAFNEQAIDDLSASIQRNGILQPLIIRPSIKGYEIVAGERRFRAAQKCGLETIPAIVREFTDDRMMEIALIENLQRENLNPLEESRAYEKLMDHFGITQEELAKQLGKSRPHIANHLRLLQLPEDIQKTIGDGQMSMGHGRALLGLKHAAEMPNAVKTVKEQQLNVRQTEELVQRLNDRGSGNKKKKEKQEPSAFIREQEDTLQTYFGTSVNIKKGKKRGKIEIEFLSDEDLTRILELLGQDKH
ncbi:ParB/RepB/Spo0J family partition protein [Salicibibacter halophilus]|uniref:ParB/RepB/Spo0J family partition protein n=1 Tax=Salicibibacter halophilus TaxID=2502791 RepID=A0A514LIH3_9BACI|nr:ParB/RepB/Spo0J family partition protein [Salicibibacter halophilus]QDI91648.1 ParB/RepB/Spo0J family partition protein [Salicibibacter halophilus]